MTRFYIGGNDLEISDSRIVELKYYILEQKKFYEDLNEELIAYGIEIEKIDDAITEVNRVEDVTCDDAKIKSLAQMLKENKVLPIHLNDVILDILS